MKHAHEDLKEIWREVPPNYYQKGVKNNILQRIWHTGKLNFAISFIPPSPTKILDVGCASGWFLSKLKQNYKKADCYGVDVYREAIAYGKKKYKNLHLKVGDAHKLPFNSSTFDVIVCCEVVEHVLNPLAVLKEIKRVLKKDGVAIIEMDSGNFLFTLVWYFWTHFRHGVWEHAHIQTLNAKKLEGMILKSGLKIKKRKIFNMSMAVIFQCKKN